MNLRLTELFLLKLNTIKQKRLRYKNLESSLTGNLERFRSEMRALLRDTQAIV